MNLYIHNKTYNEKLQNEGIKFVDIDTAYISEDTKIGQNTIIGPNVVIQNNVQIGSDCFIEMGCIIKNKIKIGNNCKILSNVNILNDVKIYNDVFVGQYTIIRDEVSIGTKTCVGPWTEIIRSRISSNCKFGHKNHISDVTILDNVCFGLGASILNSNWKQIFYTTINSNVKVGGNVTIVSPVTIGSNVTIGAGVIIKQDIPDNSLVTQEYKINIIPKRKNIL